MSQRLVFTGEQLLDGDKELARVDLYEHLLSADCEYAIVRRRSRGWHYAVVDAESDHNVCEFAPFRLRRGGSLQSDGAAVHLRAKPVRSRLWTFTAESGSRVSAKVATGAWRGEYFHTSALRIELEAEDSIEVIPRAAITLTLGCWLIRQWQMISVPNIGAGG